MKIKNATALITGATGKLGSQIAIDLAENGCDCICHYNSNAEKANNLAELIKSKGVRVITHQANLLDQAQIIGLFNTACDSFGKVDILINSASVFQKQKLADLHWRTADELLRLNCLTPVMLSKLFYEAVAKMNNSNLPLGKIINVTDVAAELNWPNYSIYCASKAALVSITKSLAKELAPKVCVNAISPGILDWPSNFEDSDELYQLSKIPARRFAFSEEITKTVQFLLENDYITGQVINVDGGRSL